MDVAELIVFAIGRLQRQADGIQGNRNPVGQSDGRMNVQPRFRQESTGVANMPLQQRCNRTLSPGCYPGWSADGVPIDNPPSVRFNARALRRLKEHENQGVTESHSRVL
jgi:hypothetical protein